MTGIKVEEPVVPAVTIPLAKSMAGVAPPEEVILPVVPDTEVTPVLATVIDPAPLVTLMPVPAVKFAFSHKEVVAL